MSFFGNLKEKLAEKRETWKQERQEKKEYQRELNKALIKARRKAYQKEAIAQASMKAKKVAQARFNPTPAQQKQRQGFFASSPNSAIQFAMGFDEPKKQERNNALQFALGMPQRQAVPKASKPRIKRESFVIGGKRILIETLRKKKKMKPVMPVKNNTLNDLIWKT